MIKRFLGVLFLIFVIFWFTKASFPFFTSVDTHFNLSSASLEALLRVGIFGGISNLLNIYLLFPKSNEEILHKKIKSRRNFVFISVIVVFVLLSMLSIEYQRQISIGLGDNNFRWLVYLHTFF